MKKILILILLCSVVFAAVSYSPIYKTDTIMVEVYNYKNIEYPSVYDSVNDTWKKSYNVSVRTEPFYEEQTIELEKIGYKISGKEYLGYNNIQDNKLIEWSVPIGDRNFKEYGRCREYEKMKGVCKETSLSGVERR